MPSSATVSTEKASSRGFNIAKTVFWATVFGSSFYFIAKNVFHYYLNYNPDGFAEHWAHRGALILHITAGMVALLAGPWQFSERLRRKNVAFHRTLGKIYLIAIGLGAIAGFWLVFYTESGWAWGTGVFFLDVAWVTTSGMAYYAILKRKISIHKEWMIRSYVVTFSFVVLRFFFYLPPFTYFEPLRDRAVVGIWACWVVPLLATDVILQLRKMQRS